MYELIAEYQEIKEYRMKTNGLTVILAPHSVAPIVGVQVTYCVGSRNEAIGYTGATHLLEHLMFKGSKKFNKELGNSIDTIENVGAVLNATTWNDRTNYYEIVPKEYVSLSLEMEADRMRHAFIAEEDRQAEMTVVRNEFERGENDPLSALHKAMWATAYQAHPYHHDTIGWLSDIEQMPIERLQKFYHDFYWPNNATVSLVGDFEQEQALKEIGQHFAPIPSSPRPLPKMYTTEPIQQGVRRIEVRRQDPVAWVAIAHKAPSARHPDHMALQLLDRIMGHGRCARLYKDLVESGLASSLFVDAHPFYDPGLYITYVMCHQLDHHAVVEKAILESYEKIKEKGVTKEEVARAQHQLYAEKAFARDGVQSLMSAINEGVSVRDWQYYLNYAERMAQVDAQDVQRVAKKYWTDDQMTIGYYGPKGGKS